MLICHFLNYLKRNHNSAPYFADDTEQYKDLEKEDLLQIDFAKLKEGHKESGLQISRRIRKEMDRLFGPMACLLYTSPSPRDGLLSRMPSSA